MDCAKVGQLIRALRTGLGYTQREVADALNISHKTVSKWELGLGCPDVSLLASLSVVLGADIENLLAGDLAANRPDTGNLRHLTFYVCPSCGNILTGKGKEGVTCCGRKLTPARPNPNMENHDIAIQTLGDEYYVSIDHEMTKGHHITFIACVGGDRFLLIRLYPEQDCAAHIPMMPGCRALYAYCNQHGLFTALLKR